MPRLVDHTARRDDLADATLRVVARDGVGGVTMRRVADESQWSTGVLQHYYGNRDALLLGALRRAAAVARRRWQALADAERDDPVAQLDALLSSVLPVDDRGLALTRIFVFFYAEAATDPELAREIGGYLANWRDDVRMLVEEGQRRGLLAEGRADDLARTLVALTDGLCIHCLYDPSIAAALRRRSPVRQWLDDLRAGAPAQPVPAT